MGDPRSVAACSVDLGWVWVGEICRFAGIGPAKAVCRGSTIDSVAEARATTGAGRAAGRGVGRGVLAARYVRAGCGLLEGFSAVARGDCEKLLMADKGT